MEAVLKAEFPSWHLCACLDVFNLKCINSKLHSRSDAVCKNLAKLALALDLDADKLQAEYAKLLPVASALQKQGSLENTAAWEQAVQRTQGTSSSRRTYSIDNLITAGLSLSSASG